MYHVLRRQLTPRHSPSALVAFDLCCRELVASRVTFHDVVSTSATSSPMHDVSRHPHRCSFTLLFSSSYSLVKERALRATSRVSPLLTLALSPRTKRPDILVGSRKLTVDCLSTLAMQFGEPSSSSNRLPLVTFAFVFCVSCERRQHSSRALSSCQGSSFDQFLYSFMQSPCQLEIFAHFSYDQACVAS